MRLTRPKKLSIWGPSPEAGIGNLHFYNDFGPNEEGVEYKEGRKRNRQHGV